MDEIIPTIAALLVVFFQNNPIKNTPNTPGLTKPVYSCIYWNICGILPNNGANSTAMIKAAAATVRPTVTNFCSLEFLPMYGL